MTKNEKLKNARIRSGLSQEEVAAKLGVSQAYIGGIESNKSFSLKRAKQLGAILGVDGESLYFSDNQNITKEEENADKIEAKDDLINSLKEIIRSKDKLIAMLERENEQLRESLNQYEGKSKTGTN